MGMAVVTSYLSPSPLISLYSLGRVSQCSVSRKRAPVMAVSSSSASIADQNCGGARLSRLLEFPHVSSAHRDLMVEVVSAFEARLGSHLLPCTLPPDVQYYENQDGTAQACLNIRSGRDSSPVDFVVGSWLHCPVPSGGALDITSFFAYLKPSTDAPNFLIELIGCSPTSMILFLDLFPRKDLVLHPDYRKTFYEDTKLETCRQVIKKIPEVQHYYASSLYVRCFASPTAIMSQIETEAGGADRMEEILRSDVTPVAKEVLGIWLDEFAFREREVDESERAHLEKRDAIMKRQSIEIDLCSSLPRLFGAEIAGRVAEAVRRVYNL